MPGDTVSEDRRNPRTRANALLGLFQSDHDLDMVGDFEHEAGLEKLEEAAIAEAKAAGKTDEEIKGIYYTMYGGGSAQDVIRRHLDSGVLLELIEKWQAKLLAVPEEFQFFDPCYEYVLLGACAMTLGCTLPESYLSMLKRVYTEGGLMPDALKQMKKALFGPDGFENGTPYDFESEGLLETAASSTAEPGPLGWVGLNVIGPGGFWNTGMGDSTTSSIIKELRSQHNRPSACGSCGTEEGKDGGALFVCSRCKARKYCGPACQKSHWKVHKKICELAEK